MLEVELKYPVPDLAPIRRQLSAWNARPCGRQHERDVYYNAPHRDFAETDEALRVRYTGGDCFVTYKGPKIELKGTKAREEYNLQVESGAACEEIFGRLGFQPTAEVNKLREIFELDDATVTLDEVDGLGTFIEIEVLAEENEEDAADRVTALAKELGVEGMPLYTSYLELILSKQ
ncbi:class IV adenylate cyclase [Methanoculleus sp. FWC-SCC1]|uniref:Class IV adenylate cyclase n=1 Tax=Methanoculleus frigidifontis TaxID=2584085 RepID=A0ABT8M638_9EURY|nr:class IV adenylate cyclase [Methanoculleus sp. FWC-SCC1]MDN7023400.1 class IV adenylate cyclase [Methanoculleus sp. FWC-SCC1]